MATDAVSVAVPFSPSQLEAERKALAKNLEDQVAALGKTETSNFDNLIGSCEDLWADESEFDEFLANIRAIRQGKD